MGSLVAMIPDGLTSLFQPLDICLNKSFEDKIRSKWMKWMSSGDATITKNGNFLKVDIVTISEWVKEAWLELPEEMIFRSFKNICISNAINGSGDHTIFENDLDNDYLHLDVLVKKGDSKDLLENFNKDVDD